MINILKLNTDIWNISNTELPILAMEKSHIASGHIFDEIYTIDKEVSCLYEGRKSRHCKECDVVTDIVTIIPAGHQWNKGNVTKKATYAQEGIRLYTCSVCGGTREESIDMLELTQPQILSAENVGNGVSIKWNKVKGAAGYRIYRKSGKGAWSQIAQVKSGSSTSYIDTKAKDGITYAYTVSAYNGKNESTYSQKGKNVIRLKAPNISQLKNKSAKSFLVKWTKNSKVNGYQIQYSTSSKFKRVKKISVSANTLSKTVKKLSKGKKYYVRVRACKKSGKVEYYSAWSSVKSVKIKK